MTSRSAADAIPRTHAGSAERATWRCTIMRQVLQRIRAHYIPLGGRMLAHVRNERYSEYSRYAFLLGLSVALFSRLPLGSDAMLIGSASPRFALLACISGAVGSGLTVAMAL